MTVIARMTVAAALLVLATCAAAPVFNVDYDMSYLPGETAVATP